MEFDPAKAQIRDSQIAFARFLVGLIGAVREQDADTDEEPGIDLDDIGAIIVASFGGIGELVATIQAELSASPEDNDALLAANLMSGGGIAAWNHERWGIDG